ncbi:MAG: hypothetical protein FIA91_03620 [Geobacter sp.]|nr:hypothetical protein [Geobacter sp.]
MAPEMYLTSQGKRKLSQHNNVQPLVTLGELYAAVNRITLFVAFEETDAESEANYQQIIFTADNAAIFRLDCSRDNCTGGGFDFAPVIDTMMAENETMAHGRLACAGALSHAESSCSLQAEYRIIIH